MAERIEVTPARPTRGLKGGRPKAIGRVPRLVTQVTKSRTFRMPEIAVGVLLVVGCAALAVLWSQSNDTSTTVVVAARPIKRGSIIIGDDLRGAAMSGSTSSMILGANAKSLLGQVALVDLDTDAPFSSSVVTATAPLSLDEALTSMALAPGQLPPDLAPNDHVRVVVIAAPDATGLAQPTLLDAQATVWSVTTAPDSTTTVVTLRGPLSLSSAVAAASKVQLARVSGQ